MKNVKKVIAMALAIVMILTVATGCMKKPALSASEPTDEHNHTEAAPTTEPTVEPTEEPTEAKEEVQYTSVVYISVNPLFAIYFDADGKVIKATAENDDGEVLDVNLDALVGTTSTVAVDALLDTIAEAGYFEDGEHDIELTFYGEEEGIVENIADLGELEKVIYEATEAYVVKNEINATVKAKKSPTAASAKQEEIEKVTEPTEVESTEAPTTAPTTAPKPTEPSHQHDYQSEIIAPTCTKDGYTKHTCSTCGSAYTDNYTKKTGTDHDYAEEVVKATYETGGYTKYTCKICGHYYEGSQTAPFYDPTASPEATNPDGSKCPFCGGPHYLYECPAAKEDAAKPTEPIKCGLCGSTTCPYLSDPENDGHDITQCPAYDEKKDPTIWCQTCGKSTKECVRFWCDVDECGGCGAAVPANTCHYCSNVNGFW